MQSLYTQILASTSELGCVTVEQMISKSGVNIREPLIQKGYAVDKLTDRQIAILFTALVDIIVVVSDDNFYLATMSFEKLNSLYTSGRLIPNKHEKDFTESYQVIVRNTQDIINKYLARSTFHLVKLNMVDSCKDYSFLSSVSGMKPYPKLVAERVYSLSTLANWHQTLSCELLRGCKRIITKDDNIVVCQNFMPSVKSIPTSGCILTKTTDNELLRLKLWDIKEVEDFYSSPIIEKLTKGVMSYKGVNITLNRDILEQYYGKVLFTELESIGVRMRYCLEELYRFDSCDIVPAYFIAKYNLNVKCDTRYKLQEYLIESLSNEKPTKQNPNVIHARCLVPYNVISNNHKSFYRSINLSHLDEDLIEVTDLTTVLPQIYNYYAISESLGYNVVSIKEHSVDLALKSGKIEFERQFGKIYKFSALAVIKCDKGVRIEEVIKGHTTYSIGLNLQQNLCNNMLCGYIDNFESYSKRIREVCTANYLINPTDDMIKYIFTNSVAKTAYKPYQLKFHRMVECLINFLDVLTSEDTADKALKEALMNVFVSKAYADWKRIKKSAPNFDGFAIQEEVDGSYIVTRCAKYKVMNNTLSSKVSILYNEQEIGVKMFKG